MFVRRFLTAALIACGIVVGSAPGRAAPDSQQPELLKAAYLYNFAKFIEWPADSFADDSAPMALCVLGTGPFSSVLAQTLRGKTVQGRPVVIKQLDEVQDADACHILFIATSERERTAQILERLEGSAVLMVGETEGFARLGGSINFVTERNKLRFEINVDAAKRAELRISSRLLGLARVVTDEQYD